jgi:hypothetical protein
MQLSSAAEPADGDVDGDVRVGDVDVAAVSAPGALRNEVRANLLVAGFSVGLSVAVAVGLSLLMTLLG